MENENQKAHRVFKFYKATGKFPPDVSELQSYTLLKKYNYFIASNLDKTKLNTLTEICNVLDREKIVVVFGDFLLDDLTFGLKSFKFEEKRRVKLICLDANDTIAINDLNSISITSSHLNSYIIYVIDNVDQLKKKDIDGLIKLKSNLEGSNKSIVCCALSIDDLQPQIKMAFKRFRFGETNNNELTIKNYVYALFNEPNRKKAFELINNAEFGEKYFLSVVIHNIPHFFEKDFDGLSHNIEIIEKANSLLYKVTTELLWRFVVFRFKPTTIKRVIRFPIVTQRDGIEKQGKVNFVTKKSVTGVTNATSNAKNDSRKMSKKLVNKPKTKNGKKGGLMRYAK